MVKRRVLVVDDEKGFTEMLKLNLEMTDQYDVLAVNDPMMAIQAAIQYHPDIILLDVIMPQMEGPDIAHYLKSHEKLKDIPIIFLTATVTRDEVAAQGGRIGGHSFVAKPSSMTVLICAMEKGMAAFC